MRVNKITALGLIRHRRGVSVAACAAVAGIKPNSWYRRERRPITASRLAECKAQIEQASIAEMGGVQLDLEYDAIRRF